MLAGHEREEGDGPNLGPEGAQTSGFKHLPPVDVIREGHVPDVYLELELTEGEGLAGGKVRLDEC